MNILAYFAHPDDETMACGATLALAARGARLSVLCATRGEGGELGEPPLCLREDAGATRSEELRLAVEALGAAELDFLNYVDPLIGPDNTLYPFAEDEELLAQQVAAAVRRTQADVLISHGSNGEYGHPAHKLCHRSAVRAIQLLGPDAPLFYTVQAVFENMAQPVFANVDDPAHLILDLEPYRAAKTAAAMCHRSQHALFKRHASQEQGRTVEVPEIIQTIESVHRAYPAVAPHTPVNDAFADLLRGSGLSRENPVWLG
jgi:LmbE family N-acetylglucosaminyl deacetylase